MVSFRTHVPLLLYLTGIFFLTFLARIVLTPLLPAIEGDLNIGHGKAGSLFLNISLGFFTGVLGSGLVSSHLTHRWTIILSSVAVEVSLLAVSLSHTLCWIRLGLIMVGLSTGLYLPSGIATLTDIVNPKDWGKAIAVHELAPILSFITALLLAEGLMIWFSWWGVVSVVGGAAIVAGGIFTCLGRGGAFFWRDPKSKKSPNSSHNSFFLDYGGIFQYGHRRKPRSLYHASSVPGR